MASLRKTAGTLILLGVNPEVVVRPEEMPDPMMRVPNKGFDYSPKEQIQDFQRFEEESDFDHMDQEPERWDGMS